MKVAQDAADWIASGSNAAAIAAKNTSQWIAESSNSVVNAARNTSDWIASSSNAVVLAFQDAEKWAAERASAARNTSEWVASNSSAAVFAAQDTGEWIAASSGAAISLVIDAASHTFHTFAALEDWSANIVRQVESHLRADPTSEFAVLVRESGFALTDVKVGVGLIPDLTVEFRRERNLDPTESQAFKTRVDAYARNAAGPVGYFEGLLLRRLLKAGEYSGGMRISEVHVDVFPLPGLQVFFDPFGFEEEENKMLVDAYDMAQAETTDLKSIEERISKIEAMLSAPQIKK
jgi:hypothetical protein